MSVGKIGDLTFSQYLQSVQNVADNSAPSQTELEVARAQYHFAKKNQTAFHTTKEIRIEIAIGEFSTWAHNQKEATFDLLGYSLLEWLKHPYHAELIQTYEEFLSVAKKATSSDFDIANLPTAKEVNETMQLFFANCYMGQEQTE